MSLEQSMSALNKANEVRLRRSVVKAEIGRMAAPQGSAMVRDILSRDPDPALRTMEITELLCAIDRVGPTRAQELIRSASFAGQFMLSSVRALGQLTARQRSYIAAVLESKIG